MVMITKKQITRQQTAGLVLNRIRPHFKDLLAILLIAFGILFFFREEIQYNITFYESDTPAYYFPVMSDLAQAYRERTLRLWSPDVFGGFPLFADGESGALYPINLLLLPFFTIEQAWVWLIFIRFFMGAVFMYLFGRVLGLGQTSSLIAAIVFTFGGFAIGQLHHINVSNSAIWLPLTLALIELAIRSRGWGRVRWLLAAGVSSAFQALGVHVQVVLMSALFLSLYVPFRVIFCPTLPFRKHASADGEIAVTPTGNAIAVDGDRLPKTGKLAGPRRENPLIYLLSFLRKVPKRIILTSFILALPGFIGLALASVQLFPEYELGTFSSRAGGVSYSYATLYSLTGYSFITLLLPYFFRDGSFFWGLWSMWESAIYVGILPLLLCFVAVLWVRSRYTLFLGIMGVFALWAALGGSANPNLHYLLYQLPGFNQMRVPARFSYLMLLCVAILSAHAIEWLVRESLSLTRSVPLPTSRKLSRAAFSGLTVLLIPLIIAIPVYLESVASWFRGNKDFALTLIRSTFLNLPRGNPDLTGETVFDELLRSVSPVNPDTQMAFTLVAASLFLLLLWDRLRNISWLWKVLAVVLVAFDLMSYAAVFHPRITIEQLSSESKATAFLAQHRGMYRAYSWPASSVQPNRLLTFDVPDARGYSSLEFQRNQEYSAVIETVENRLLDLWNVRYIPIKKETRSEPLPTFNETQFHTRRLLMSSSSKNASSSVSYTVPDRRTTDVRIIGRLRDCADVPQGTVVGNIVLTEASGTQIRLPISAGIDISEGAIDRPDVASRVKHARATVAFSMPEQRLDGIPYQERLYYARLQIPDNETVRVTKVKIDYTYPVGKLQVSGLTLYDGIAKQSFPLNPFMKDRYRMVFEGETTSIYENQSYLPRSFLVPTAVPVESNFDILSRMTDGDWDPLKKVLIEAPMDTPLPTPQPVPSAGIGTVAITDYKDREVKISANANIDSYLFLADSFYPGWKASVDGQEVPIYRANYLFRAIVLPKGPHQIVFSYDPGWFKVGAIISLTTLFLLCSLLAFWIAMGVLRGRLVVRRASGAKTVRPPLTHGEVA